MKIVLNQEQILQSLKLYAQALTGHDFDGATYFFGKDDKGKWEITIKMKEVPTLPEIKVEPKQVSQDEIEKVYAPVAKRTPDVT